MRCAVTPRRAGNQFSSAPTAPTAPSGPVHRKPLHSQNSSCLRWFACVSPNCAALCSAALLFCAVLWHVRLCKWKARALPVCGVRKCASALMCGGDKCAAASSKQANAFFTFPVGAVSQKYSSRNESCDFWGTAAINEEGKVFVLPAKVFCDRPRARSTITPPPGQDLHRSTGIHSRAPRHGKHHCRDTRAAAAAAGAAQGHQGRARQASAHRLHGRTGACDRPAGIGDGQQQLIGELAVDRERAFPDERQPAAWAHGRVRCQAGAGTLVVPRHTNPDQPARICEYHLPHYTRTQRAASCTVQGKRAPDKKRPRPRLGKTVGPFLPLHLPTSAPVFQTFPEFWADCTKGAKNWVAKNNHAVFLAPLHSHSPQTTQSYIGRSQVTCGVCLLLCCC